MEKDLGKAVALATKRPTATSGVKLTSQGHQEAGGGRQGRGGRGHPMQHGYGRVFCGLWAGVGGGGA